MSSRSSPLIVGFPLFDDLTIIDLIGAVEVFSNTKGYFQPVLFAPEIRPYRTCVNTVANHPICITPQFTFDDPNRPKIDILFAIGGLAGCAPPLANCRSTFSSCADLNNQSGFVGAMFDSVYQDFILQVAAEEATWVGSVCAGAFILAAAGLYDGCTVTTYWSLVEQFRRLPNITVPEGYPRVLIQEFEVEGITKRRFSGGGDSSSIDLGLALVKQIAGEEIAAYAQLVIQYAPNPIINYGDPINASQGMVGESPLVTGMRMDHEEMIDVAAEAIEILLQKLSKT
ncbi:MAG: hypothetical protein F6J87_21530 [Spirulina sp. SIO3F2]|nr:hypothetical protein [Spirulina sp. SIO3F2]